MTDILGVEINLSKSLQSEISVCEFAKRLVDHENEFTPVGTNLLFQATKGSASLFNVLLDLSNKGMTWSSEGIKKLLDSNRIFKNLDP